MTLRGRMGWLIVSAIDFGTTYSGWSFSFKNDFESDPTKATVSQWNNGVTITEKTPTCVLIGPDKTMIAFGYEAENIYKELTDKKEHKQYFYFKRFKMLLCKKLGEGIGRDITLQDELGKSLPAVMVFSIAIKFLTENMLEVLKKCQTDTLRSKDVHWVLTLPAIWTDAAKQFMRLSANKAGIDNNRLTIALEPEAASLYCRHLSVEKTVDRNVSIPQFKAGTRYLILDAGGGTVDINVHEITSTGQIKEIQSASGGGWGGILVDRAFEDLMIKIFGQEVYEEFKKNETEDWLDLWREFEVKKRSVSEDTTARVVMKFPVSLKNMYEKSTGTETADAIAESRYAKDIVVDRDKLKFEPKLMRRFFSESISEIVDHLRNILSKLKIKAILMVGGFSESPMLQNAIKSEFACEGRDVVIPLSASSSILRGALIYGHSPGSITERVLKHTYGVAYTVPFQNGVHPVRHRRTTDYGTMCDNVFDKHVEKDQTVKVDEPQVEITYVPNKKFQRYREYRIYASQLRDPEYVDEGCTCIGNLKIEISDPDGDLDRGMIVSLTFSGTEIIVEARDERTGTKYSTKIDFLG